MLVFPAGRKQLAPADADLLGLQQPLHPGREQEHAELRHVLRLPAGIAPLEVQQHRLPRFGDQDVLDRPAHLPLGDAEGIQDKELLEYLPERGDNLFPRCLRDKAKDRRALDEHIRKLSVMIPDHPRPDPVRVQQPEIPRLVPYPSPGGRVRVLLLARDLLSPDNRSIDDPPPAPGEKLPISGGGHDRQSPLFRW